MPPRVCLINPPVTAVLEPWYDRPDFGRTSLACLAGHLRASGEFDILLIDAKLERLSFDETLARVLRFGPDLVGLTAFTNEIKPAAFVAHSIKEHLPRCVTVVGGPHVTAIPEETLNEFPMFDIGAVGEGEETLLELCRMIGGCSGLPDTDMLHTVNGIVFRKGGSPVLSSPRNRILDQDSIPFPAWDLLPRAATYYVQTVRGCPLNCLFCMNPNGRVARTRSVGNVTAELEWILTAFRPERISFGDELFSVDMGRTATLLDALAEMRFGERVRWDVQTHVRYVDRNLFNRFRRAGVERVELGVETGDEEALRRMGKGTTVNMILDACRAAKEEGVSVGTFFLLGQPHESRQSLRSTVELAVRINPDLPMFGIMTPYPGTEVARMAAKGEGGYKLLSTDWDVYNKQIGGAMSFSGLSRRQIEWFQLTAYLKVYLLNRRFRDLTSFFWQYHRIGLEVLWKILTGRGRTDPARRPKDYDLVLGNRPVTGKQTMVDARERWNREQQREMARARELAPHLLRNVKT